jgi:hypothetical protein
VVRPAKGALSVEPVRGALKPPKPLAAKEAPTDKCGPDEEADEDEEVTIDPATREWGGPTKGGRMPEPTRFGDWERKGRLTDF